MRRPDPLPFGSLVVAAVIATSSCGGGAPPPGSGVVNAPETTAIDPAPYLAAFPLTAPEVPPVNGDTAYDRALEAALAPLRAGDYTQAATALDGLLLDHPGEPRAQLYLGIARLFQDEPQNALELLRPLEFNAPPEVAAEAAWYGLVGIARLRDPSGVRAEAQSLCERGWTTSPRACAALGRLAPDRPQGR